MIGFTDFMSSPVGWFRQIFTDRSLDHVEVREPATRRGTADDERPRRATCLVSPKELSRRPDLAGLDVAQFDRGIAHRRIGARDPRIDDHVPRRLCT